MAEVATKHFYLVIFCKSCQSIVPLRYLHDRYEERLNTEWPGFTFDCPKCGREHLYKLSDVSLIDLPTAPPENWKDRI